MDDDDPVVLPTRKIRWRIPIPLVAAALGFLGFAAIAYFGGVGGRRTVAGEQQDNLAAAGEAASVSAVSADRSRYLGAIAEHGRRCPAGTSQRVQPESQLVHLFCARADGTIEGAQLRIDLEGRRVDAP